MSKPTFEQAITELERTVDKLESGDLDLETSLKDFERGIKIQNYCKNKLEEATLQLNLLLGDQKLTPLAPQKNPQQPLPQDSPSDLFDLE
jgi:exodeoxyribonuclease VII small subunit